MNYRPSFWEKFSRIHARDLSFVDKFIGEINNNPNSEITIASAQAGMVPYYVRQNMRQKLRFIDLLGLTSKDVQNCLMWPVDPYSQWPATSECLTEPIDYIFDLDNQNFDRMSLLISTGCTEVFREEVVLNQPSWKHERVWRQFLVKCSSD